jgi:hypothetical protein
LLICEHPRVERSDGDAQGATEFNPRVRLCLVQLVNSLSLAVFIDNKYESLVAILAGFKDPADGPFEKSPAPCRDARESA